MFGVQKLQLLEMGTRLLKATIAESRSDGSISVESMRVVGLPFRVSGLETYLDGTRPMLESLARGFFRKNEPVHLLPLEGIVRSEIHTLPAVGEDSVARILVTSRRHFVSSFSIRVPIYEKSFPIHIAKDGDLVRVTVVHSYCRRSDAALIQDWLHQANLKLGSVLSPLLSLSELARWRPANEDGSTLQLHVDVGAAASSLLPSEGGLTVAYRKAFTGCADWISPLMNEFPQLDPGKVVEIEEKLRKEGFVGVEAMNFGSASGEDVAGALKERVLSNWDELFDAVGQMAPGVCRPAQESPEDSDDDIGIAPTLQGTVIFSGGGASIPGFVERAATRLGVPCSRLEAATLPGWNVPGSLALPPAAVGSTLGALAVLARLGPQNVSVAEEVFSPRVTGEDRGPSVLASLVMPLAIGAALTFVVSFACFLASWYIDHTSDEMARSIEMEKATMPANNVFQETMVQYRDLRSREAAIDARFQYVDRILPGRRGWPELLGAIARAVPQEFCRLKGLEVLNTWPGATGAQNPVSRGAVFKIQGAARSLEGVTSYILRLNEIPFLRNSRVGGSSGEGDAQAAQTSSAYPYVFEITGEIADDRLRED